MGGIAVCLVLTLISLSCITFALCTRHKDCPNVDSYNAHVVGCLGVLTVAVLQLLLMIVGVEPGEKEATNTTEYSQYDGYIEGNLVKIEDNEYYRLLYFSDGRVVDMAVSDTTTCKIGTQNVFFYRVPTCGKKVIKHVIYGEEAIDFLLKQEDKVLLDDKI